MFFGKQIYYCSTVLVRFGLLFFSSDMYWLSLSIDLISFSRTCFQFPQYYLPWFHTEYISYLVVFLRLPEAGLEFSFEQCVVLASLCSLAYSTSLTYAPSVLLCARVVQPQISPSWNLCEPSPCVALSMTFLLDIPQDFTRVSNKRCFLSHKQVGPPLLLGANEHPSSECWNKFWIHIPYLHVSVSLYLYTHVQYQKTISQCTLVSTVVVCEWVNLNDILYY